jgi:hypothetical protein
MKSSTASEIVELLLFAEYLCILYLQRPEDKTNNFIFIKCIL